MDWNVPEIRGDAKAALESLAVVESSRSGGEPSDESRSIEGALVQLLGAVGEPVQVSIPPAKPGALVVNRSKRSVTEPLAAPCAPQGGCSCVDYPGIPTVLATHSLIAAVTGGV